MYASHCVKIIQQRYDDCIAKHTTENTNRPIANINVILIGHSMAGMMLPNIVQLLYQQNKNSNIITSVVFIASILYI